ncbi:DNA repair protein RecO [Anaerophilus nitritogenes]|uniref:DNA repair protein RecO n=1 Tax=Anaerophilus nitritogenes TaxID=2498136 RepID=UPI00101DCD8D|nr:DNA repair protein RecO [Anaerophilus nitritogenes]
MLIKTDAVILKQTKFGEGDAIVTLFAKKIGKVQAVAKGVKRSKGKYAVGTQPFCYGEYVLYKGKDLYQISQIDLKDSFYKLREDVLTLAYASYILELTENILTEGQTNHRLFYTLLKWIHIFSLQKGNHETLVKAYEMKLICFSGYEPQIKNCVSCGKTAEKVKFSSREGGILCSECSSQDPYAMKISKVTINVMTYLIEADLEKICRLKIKPDALKELNKIIKHYISTHIGKDKFKSMAFLQAIQP